MLSAQKVAQNEKKLLEIQKVAEIERQEEFRENYLVSDNVAGVKGPAKAVCCQIMVKSYFQI